MDPTASTPDRLDLLRKSVTYYHTDLGLTPIRVHYPEKLPATTPMGKCSCGSAYRLDEHSKPTRAHGLCPTPGKHPVATGWTNGGDTAQEWVSTPWNIGLICGPEHDLLVLDIDVRNQGTETYSLLAPLLNGTDGAGTPWTSAHFQTFSYFTSGHNGSRGYHMLFHVDPDSWPEITSAPSSLHGLDIKSNGMVVAAPSVHATGDSYELRSGAQVQGLDHGQATRLGHALRHLHRGFGGENTDDLEGRISKVQVMLDLMTGVQTVNWGPGEKHDNLKPLLGAFIHQVLTDWNGATNKPLLSQLLARAEEDHQYAPLPLLRLCQGWNFATCSPPWSDQELQTMVASFWRRHLQYLIDCIEAVERMAVRGQTAAQPTTAQISVASPEVTPVRAGRSTHDYLLNARR